MQSQPIFYQLHDDFVRNEPAMLCDLGRFNSEWCLEIFFATQDRPRRCHRYAELASYHLSLSSLPGTRRAQEHESPLHLMPVKEDRDTSDHDYRDGHVEPH